MSFQRLLRGYKTQISIVSSFELSFFLRASASLRNSIAPICPDENLVQRSRTSLGISAVICMLICKTPRGPSGNFIFYSSSISSILEQLYQSCISLCASGLWPIMQQAVCLSKSARLQAFDTQCLTFGKAFISAEKSEKDLRGRRDCYNY
jgi:hypothetical protein